MFSRWQLALTQTIMLRTHPWKEANTSQASRLETHPFEAVRTAADGLDVTSRKKRRLSQTDTRDLYPSEEVDTLPNGCKIHIPEDTNTFADSLKLISWKARAFLQTALISPNERITRFSRRLRSQLMEEMSDLADGFGLTLRLKQAI